MARGSEVRGSAAEKGAGRGPGMHAQLGKDPLGMVPGSVGADLQRRGDCDVGSSLCYQHCDLDLPGGEPIGGLEGGSARRTFEAGRASSGRPLLQQTDA